MQIHQLKPIHKNKKRKIVGRGGSHGTYSGHGIKGQKSRAGRKLEPMIRIMIKRYPKLRGYRFKSLKAKPSVINIGIFEKNFKEGEMITPQILVEKGLIRRLGGKTPAIKILGKGNLTKNLIIENCEVSKTAKEKIEKSGGAIKIK